MSDTDLSTQSGGALATKSEFNRPFQMEGEDRDDDIMPRVVLHQGDMSENAGHGEHDKGTILNSVTKEVIESHKFVPIGVAWKQYIRFGANRGDPIVYNTRDRAAVPDADTKWQEKTPPVCTVFRNFVVLFEGEETPVCLSFKSSDKIQNNAGKSLNLMEKSRTVQGKCPGLYELEIVDDSNDKGKWKNMRPRPCGDPTTEMLTLSQMWFGVHSGSAVKVQEQTASDYDPDQDT